MTAPADILRRIAELCGSSSPFALVTLLNAEGSTPARIGSQAIVDPDGNVAAGTIGGGALEGLAQQRAAEALRTGDCIAYDVDLQGVGPPVPDPICGGRLRVLIDPAPARHQEAYHLAARARSQHRRGLLLTSAVSHSQPPEPRSSRREEAHSISGEGSQSLLTSAATVQGFKARSLGSGNSVPDRPVVVSVRWLDESSNDTFSGFPTVEDLRRVLQQEASRCFTRLTGETRIDALAELVAPAPVLLIIGGGHVGQALAFQAKVAGFDIAVMDDRDEFTRPDLFPPGTTLHRGNLVKQVSEYPFAPDTFIALMTRGHKIDAEALEICLKQPHAYLGMIGSRRKVHLVRSSFIESGRATPGQWSRIYAPIGLDLGAVTVPEIAVSIVAQLIAVRRRGQAGRIPV